MTWLSSVEEAQAADRTRKAARLKAVLHPVKAEGAAAEAPAPVAGVPGGASAVTAPELSRDASGLGAGTQGQADGAPGDSRRAAGSDEKHLAEGAGGGKDLQGEGEGVVDNNRGEGRDADVRRALESRGWLLDASQGGGWAPARISVQGATYCASLDALLLAPARLPRIVSRHGLVLPVGSNWHSMRPSTGSPWNGILLDPHAANCVRCPP